MKSRQRSKIKPLFKGMLVLIATPVVAFVVNYFMNALFHESDHTLNALFAERTPMHDYMAVKGLAKTIFLSEVVAVL